MLVNVSQKKGKKKKFRNETYQPKRSRPETEAERPYRK